MSAFKMMRQDWLKKINITSFWNGTENALSKKHKGFMWKERNKCTWLTAAKKLCSAFSRISFWTWNKETMIFVHFRYCSWHDDIKFDCFTISMWHSILNKAGSGQFMLEQISFNILELLLCNIRCVWIKSVWNYCQPGGMFSYWRIGEVANANKSTGKSGR